MLYNLFENRDFVSVFAVALLAEGVDRNLVQFKSKHIGMVQRQLGIPADKDYTESGKKRWKPNEKLATLSSPSGSAMHHTVWEMQEQTVEQMLQQNTERRVRQLIANAKRKGVI